MTRKADAGKPRPRANPPRKASRKKTSVSKPAPHLPTDFPGTRYIFFGGKGGVGKTTAAAAAALLLLDNAAEGERILLFSTDPAHSLSDSLGLEIGDRLVEVARRGVGVAASRLLAREMDAVAALAEFKTRHRAVLAEIADRGTLLDEADINELLDLSLPGMDEVMSLFELSEVEREGSFARVVVDTAPSGHTSRLLRLPEVFRRWAYALDRMNEKHRYMVAQFARGRRARVDEVEVFLKELSERIEAARRILFDPARASFTLVTIPEALSVEESVRYFRILRDEGVPVTDALVNRVERERDDCPYCRARTRAQSPWLAEIEREFNPLHLRRVPLLPQEIRGEAGLRRFAHLAWGKGDEADSRVDSPTVREGVSMRLKPPPSRSGYRLQAKRLVIFGGKGGTGKTTAAAAAALALAEGDDARRVLIFSTDPAHSLSDSFDEEIGALKKGVAGLKNLDAMEIDPAARFEELKERYRRWTDELFDSLTTGTRWEVQFDREAMREMVALAPPGIDEIAALSAVSDLIDKDAYTSIVLDTAPTGHLIRFLELPEVALSWVKTFIKLMLKYKGIVRYGVVAEELVALSKSIKRVSGLLTDAAASEFVGVAIPETMSLEETARLSESLERLKVPMRRLLVNNVVSEEAAEGCDFCAARRAAQGPVIKNFVERFAGKVELFAAPQQPQDIHGPARLREHFAYWEPLERDAHDGM